MVPSASIPAVRQNRSKLTETASQALSTAPIPVGGKAVNGVIAFFMALLSFRGISTPSLPAQGEQRRSSYFNILRGNSVRQCAIPGKARGASVGRYTELGSHIPDKLSLKTRHQHAIHKSVSIGKRSIGVVSC